MSLHPFINAMLENSVYTPGLSAGTPEQGRAIVAEGRNALGTGPDMERISDIEIPAREGPLRARNGPSRAGISISDMRSISGPVPRAFRPSATIARPCSGVPAESPGV